MTLTPLKDRTLPRWENLATAGGSGGSPFTAGGWLPSRVRHFRTRESTGLPSGPVNSPGSQNSTDGAWSCPPFTHAPTCSGTPSASSTSVGSPFTGLTSAPLIFPNASPSSWFRLT